MNQRFAYLTLQSSHPLADIYTYSAKEKDSETGLSYFGSRYYSSDLSVWLSVDPMASKYPSLSPYVYCANNPVRVVDPDGEDEWEVNQSGYIRHIQNGKPDRLYAVYGFGKERWGKRKTDVEPLDVDKSIMGTMDNRGKYTTFTAQNDRTKMDELFNFFADNTEVEWTQLSIHDEYENQYDFLSTSHENINSDLPSLYKSMVHTNAKRGTLDTFKHSHPNHYTGFKYYYKIIYPYTSHIPSGGDMETKQNILKECGSGKLQPRFILRNGGRSNGY
ncbi:MAG: JAB-like toxin 1 domain-containing protein [Bacteroidales bacterium]|nr:JAB-like toxin 1 domain-containing protein [Bacteroidales bacterium]